MQLVTLKLREFYHLHIKSSQLMIEESPLHALDYFLTECITIVKKIYFILSIKLACFRKSFDACFLESSCVGVAFLLDITIGSTFVLFAEAAGSFLLLTSSFWSLDAFWCSILLDWEAISDFTLVEADVLKHVAQLREVGLFDGVQRLVDALAVAWAVPLGM